MLIGILAGIATGALWGLTFVAPLAVAPVSAWDLTVARYGVFGLASALLMILPRFRPTGIGFRRMLVGLCLGGLGYTGYVAGIFFSVRLAGVAIPPLVIGLAPILLALVGNRRAAVPWAGLAVPLALIAGGLALVNASALASADLANRAAILSGVGCAVMSLVVWVVYATVNASVMREPGAPEALRWTGVQGLGAALGSLVLLGPLTSIRAPGDIVALVSSPGGPRFLAWAAVMGLGGSWLATWCWVVASRRLPLALAAQLIVGETVFGLIYGFLYEGRWPSAAESCGAALQIGGVIAAVALFHRHRDAARADLGPSGSGSRTAIDPGLAPLPRKRPP